MLRSELWVEGEDRRVAGKRGRGGMVNWRVDEGSHAMDVMGVEMKLKEVALSLLNWTANLQVSERFNGVAWFMFMAENAEVINVPYIYLLTT